LKGTQATVASNSGEAGNNTLAHELTFDEPHNSGEVGRSKIVTAQRAAELYVDIIEPLRSDGYHLKVAFSCSDSVFERAPLTS
jgi:hypothetical protein